MMKRITAFIASGQKRATFEAMTEFENELKKYGDFEFKFEYVFLKDYRLENCKGCNLCFNKGEEFCPLKDDRDLLIRKMEESDGIIFATPNYAFHTPAVMKCMIDRMAFMLHRPRYFGKTFTAVVSQGILGGEDIVKYLCNSIGKNLGFSVSKGCVVRSLEPRTEKQQKQAGRRIDKCAARFHAALLREKKRSPGFFRLMLFRISRTNIKTILNAGFRDYSYYSEQGWFENDYYYPVKLGFFKKLAGRFFDNIGLRIAKNR